MQGWKRADSRVRYASYTSLNRDKMLNVGHLDVNSVQFCSDSLKQRLKQTMLNQELVYMGQVLELHRLYRIQIAMAEDIKQSGLDGYNSHARGVNSSSVNLNSQVNYSLSDIQCSSSGFSQKKPFDLNLTADEYNGQSAKKNSVSFDLNISLNIGEETSKNGEEHRSWMGKRTIAPPLEIIDLEDPNSKKLNNDENPTLPSHFASPNPSLKKNNILERSIISDKHNLQSFSRNGTVHVSVPEGSTSSRPFINVDRAYQGPTLCDSGVNGDLMASDKSVIRRENMFDLNTIPIEDLSNTQSEVVIPLPTALSTVSPTSEREINLNSCAEIPDNIQNNLIFEGKISSDTKSKDNKGKIIFIDLVSDSDEELSSRPDSKIKCVGSSSKLLTRLACGLEMGETVGPEVVIQKVPEPFCQKSLVTDEYLSDQKLGNSCQPDILNVKTMPCGINGGHSNVTCFDKGQMIDMDLHSGTAQQRSSESPDSNRLCFKSKEPEVDETVQDVTDEHLSDQKLGNSCQPDILNVKTMPCGINGGHSNVTCFDKGQMIDMGLHSGTAQQRSSESPDSNRLCFKSKEPEVDETMQEAANLLVEISAKLNSQVSRTQEHNSGPQCSSDSYEAMVLNAKQCGPDDYCESSNAFVVDVSETSDSRYKLKRGTRMKNFQKDILSSLATLSRQEIREDVKIFESVIRSRDYKKMRGKMDEDSDWCIPTRSKRSRINRR